jgi:hypothetical protein
MVSTPDLSTYKKGNLALDASDWSAKPIPKCVHWAKTCIELTCMSPRQSLLMRETCIHSGAEEILQRFDPIACDDHPVEHVVLLERSGA